MSSRVRIVALTAGLAAGLAACAEARSAAGPLVAEDPAAEFGAVLEGRVLEHAWEVEVRAPLAVTAARTDCGCTLAELERADAAGGAGAKGGDRRPYAFGTELRPGERLHVRARYDTRKQRGPSVRAVTLTTTLGPPLALTLAADVRPWLLAEPDELAYARVLEGTTAERSFRVRSAGGEPFALHATGSALPPWVAVSLHPVAPGARGGEVVRAALWEVAVELGPGAPRGHFSYPIELESDVAVPGAGEGEDARRFTVAPSWPLQVVGPVALSAPALDFAVVDGDEVVARTVRLDSFDPAYDPRAARARLEPLVPGTPFPLERTAQVHARPAGSSCEIELVLAGLDAEVEGTFVAKLVVETGHPDLPRLDALVRGVRAPEASGAPAPARASSGEGTPR